MTGITRARPKVGGRNGTRDFERLKKTVQAARRYRNRSEGFQNENISSARRR